MTYLRPKPQNQPPSQHRPINGLKWHCLRCAEEFNSEVGFIDHARSVHKIKSSKLFNELQRTSKGQKGAIMAEFALDGEPLYRIMRERIEPMC